MSESKLMKLREEIDSLDKELLTVLGRRMRVVEKIGRYKKIGNLKPLDKKRWEEVLKTRISMGKLIGFPPKFIRKLFALIHDKSLSIQRRIE